MTEYSKEVINDLVNGTLPWPQTRRIMSAYKDHDRFFKYLAVLQDRVAWSDPILLPVGDRLFICDSAEGRVARCECGYSFGDYRRNWKLNAVINVRDTEESLRESTRTAISRIRDGWRSASSSAPNVRICTKSKRQHPVIQSCMISSRTSKASIATGSVSL
jgi:acetone carboxylase gamma subunit